MYKIYTWGAAKLMSFFWNLRLKLAPGPKIIANPYIRVSALIRENDKVLLVPHDYEGGQLWHLPGGKIDEKDFSLVDTLIRELKEELEIDIEVDNLVFICEDELRPSRRVLHMIFNARRKNDKQPTINRQQSGASSVDFVPLKDLSNRHLYPNISKEILSLDVGLTKHNVYLGICSSRNWL